MKSALAAIVAIIIASSTTGQSKEIDIFGYFEPQFMPVIIDDNYYQLFSNKLRVDLKSSAIKNATFAANFDYINYQGKKNWNLLDFFPDRIKESVPAGYDSLFNFSYDDTTFLDNAYFKFPIKIFDITLGKQQISLGTGYAWNPTDLFNTKDIIDPTYEQPGHTAIRLDAALSLRYNAVLMYFPEDDWNESGKLFRFKGKISHFDYSAVYVEKMWQLSDFIAFMPLYAKRHLYGGDFAGELLGLGVWGEFGYNTLKGHSDFWEALLGTDYTFNDGTYIMAEYYYNGLASPDYRQYNVNDWMRYFLAESRTISRHNMYIYADYPLTDFISLNNSFIVSLSDQSIAIVPSMRYSIYQNVEINAFLNFNIGSNLKAYSNEQGITGIIRFDIYF